MLQFYLATKQNWLLKDIIYRTKLYNNISIVSTSIIFQDVIQFMTKCANCSNSDGPYTAHYIYINY